MVPEEDGQEDLSEKEPGRQEYKRSTRPIPQDAVNNLKNLGRLVAGARCMRHHTIIRRGRTAMQPCTRCAADDPGQLRAALLGDEAAAH